MYHELLQDATFWTFLFSVDEDLAKAEKAKQCPACGGCLHRADFLASHGAPSSCPKSTADG